MERQVAVVTGAAAGIGLALVESFVADGASVVMADIDAPLLQAEAARLRHAGAEILDIAVDVGDAAAVSRLAQNAAGRFGRSMSSATTQARSPSGRPGSSTQRTGIACCGWTCSQSCTASGVDLPSDDELPAGVVSARAAAASIRAGMAAGRFYVFTHDNSCDAVNDRYERVLRSFDAS